MEDEEAKIFLVTISSSRFARLIEWLEWCGVISLTDETGEIGVTLHA